MAILLFSSRPTAIYESTAGMEGWIILYENRPQPGRRVGVFEAQIQEEFLPDAPFASCAAEGTPLILLNKKEHQPSPFTTQQHKILSILKGHVDGLKANTITHQRISSSQPSRQEKPLQDFKESKLFRASIKEPTQVVQ